VLIDDRDDLDWPPVVGGIELRHEQDPIEWLGCGVLRGHLIEGDQVSSFVLHLGPKPGNDRHGGDDTEHYGADRCSG
jgi:hypothetical protein